MTDASLAQTELIACLTLTSTGTETRVTAFGASGAKIASALLQAPDAGALGGQLVSASQRPLPHPYTLVLTIGAATEEATADEIPPAVSPALLAERPRPESATRVDAPLWSRSQPTLEARSPWRFTKSAHEHLIKHKLTREQVIEILDDPEVVAPSEHGGGTTYMRKRIGAVVPADDPHLVIAVFRETLGTSDRPRGGAGRRKASTFAEFRQMLEEHGFTVSTGGNHPKATHPDHPQSIPLPGTPSDARSFDNAIAEIRRLTGIDITRTRSRP